MAAHCCYWRLPILVLLLSLIQHCAVAADALPPCNQAKKLYDDGRYYEVLGVEKKATTKQIRKAFKKMSVKCHPDKDPDNPEAQENFIAIAGAYDTLSDESKRKSFDRHGPNTSSSSGCAGGGFQDINLNDIFKDFFPGSGTKNSDFNFGSDFDMDFDSMFGNFFSGDSPQGFKKKGSGGGGGNGFQYEFSFGGFESMGGSKKKVKARKVKDNNMFADLNLGDFNLGDLGNLGDMGLGGIFENLEAELNGMFGDKMGAKKQFIGAKKAKSKTKTKKKTKR